MTELSLTVEHRDGTTEPLAYGVDRIANCGLAVRDDVAQAHLDEMEKEGIQMTRDPPVVFQLPDHAVTTASHVQVNDPKTSGEAEYALFPTEDEVYVGVASDHTDRALETREEDIEKSKTVCPNVVSETVWPLSEIRIHWGELQLQGWTGADGESQRYQESPIDVFYPPEKMLDTVAERTDAPAAGTAVFSGTVDAVGNIEFGDFFAARLHDPLLDRSLFLEYEVEVVDWLTDDA